MSDDVYEDRTEPEWPRQHCDEPGCENEDGMPCWISPGDDEPDGYYCGEHRRVNGFCPGCGLFWAGVDSFDFSRTGLCENCASEIDDDYDDEDEGDWGWFDMYPQSWYDGSALADLEDAPTHIYIGPGSEQLPPDDNAPVEREATDDTR